ncbi:hypothetical protein RRG08_025541 [Elysia crispata]|uniref:Uncharacterized protein n=1 Tax=Elysia crispata TaxID=231223 RepID=A0AAE0YKH3_9GAST|nr:hypothetical protein RRG08_025541 [Elysia crispata]
MILLTDASLDVIEAHDHRIIVQSFCTDLQPVPSDESTDDPSEDHNIIEDLSVLLPARNDPQFQPALEAPQVSPCNCKRNNVETCLYGWFGPNCQYLCHCAGSAPCDKHDGSCSSGCHQDWFGPACQYGETLTGSSVRGTALSGEGWPLDNDDTTCNTRMSRSVTVTLDTPIPLTWVRVVLRDAGIRSCRRLKHSRNGKIDWALGGNITDPDELSRARINSSSLQTSCSEISTAKVDAEKLDIYCPASAVVLTVTLEGAAVQGLSSRYIKAENKGSPPYFSLAIKHTGKS